MKIASMCSRKNNGLLISLLLLLSFAMLTGCVTSPSQSHSVLLPPTRAGANQARLSIFLQLQEGKSGDAWMEISSVGLRGNDGLVVLAGGSGDFAAHDVADGQRFLARGVVAAGQYQHLQLSITKAVQQGEKGNIPLLLAAPQIQVALPGNFTLHAGESRSIFLRWDAADSIVEGALFQPHFNVVTEPGIPLLVDLAYVSCPEIDTLYLIRTDKNMVAGSLAIPGQPTYMVYAADRKKIYVLSQGLGLIHVVEASTGRIIDRFKIPLVSSPSYFIASDSRNGYVLAEQENELLHIDLVSGTLQNRRRLGYQPRTITWDEQKGQLIVASGLSQAIYFLDPLTLQRRDSSAVASGPEGLLREDNYLYVAEGMANTLAILDMRSMQTVKRLNVGFQPRRLASNNRHIFLTNKGSSSVSVISSHQQRLVREIPLASSPFELALSTIRPWVYVTLPEHGALGVIDQTAHRALRPIELGSAPAAVLFLE